MESSVTVPIHFNFKEAFVGEGRVIPNSYFYKFLLIHFNFKEAFVQEGRVIPNSYF